MKAHEHRRYRPFVLALFFSAVVGCAPAAPPQPGTSEGVETPVGSGGGKVSSGAAAVEVPAGALTSNATVSITTVSAGYPATAIGMTLRGEVLAFQPHGQTFAEPVTISVPFTVGADTDKLTLFTAESTGAWRKVDGAYLEGGVLKAEVDHFSFFAAGEGEPVVNCGACIAPTKDDGSQLCVQQYYDSELAVAMRAGVQSTCSDGNGTFVEECPANANPGCCMQGPSNGYLQVVCYYNCLSDVCADLSQTCKNAGGTWGRP